MDESRGTEAFTLASRRAALFGAVAGYSLVDPVRAEGPLKIGGTGSSLAALRLLAEAYARTNANSQILILPSLGSTGGIRALQAGVISLAASSRPLNEAELSAGLREIAYARTLLVFVTHPGVPTRGLSIRDVARIYSGELTTWPGGMPIRLIRRPPTEADWEALSLLSPEMASAVALAIRRPGLLTAATDQDNVETIETVRGAFGLAALGQILAERRSLSPLSLDGMEASLGALAGGRWPMVRELRLVTRSAQSPEAEGFIIYVRGPEAAALLERLGHMPLNGMR